MWGVGWLRRARPAARAAGPNHQSGLSWLPARAGPRWMNQHSGPMQNVAFRPVPPAPPSQPSQTISALCSSWARAQREPRRCPACGSTPGSAAMRFASFNVDFSEKYFQGKQLDTPKVAELLGQVDVLAVQELGTWDRPLTQEP